jgi:hypothetical protein
MRAWLGTQRSWLVVERLPAYAPELNPVEGLWSWLKGTLLANLVCQPNRRTLNQRWKVRMLAGWAHADQLAGSLALLLRGYPCVRWGSLGSS